VTVLVEACAPARSDGPPVLWGRSQREAPEVDGRVVIRGAAEAGDLLDRFVRVRITTAATYQVAGMISEELAVAAERRGGADGSCPAT